MVSVLNQNLSYKASVFECGRAEVHVCVIWSYLLDHSWLYLKAGITIFYFSRAIGGLCCKMVIYFFFSCIFYPSLDIVNLCLFSILACLPH